MSVHEAVLNHLVSLASLFEMKLRDATSML